MATLKFADTHNMVAFLSKPAESKGFEQIVDFLNANPIRYALTINPTIYTSCIEQFWATVMSKTYNWEEVELQALVMGRRKHNESTMRRELQQEMLSSKTTAWNEFSSTMASAIICLATNQKFNFSKYIFESMVENLDNAGNFLMYPRPRKPKRKDTQIPQSSGPTDNVADEAVNEEMDDSLERAATTAASLDAEQDKGGGPRRQETMGDTIAQTRFENVSKTSNDPLLARDGDEVIVENVDVATTTTKTNVEVTLAQELAELKSVKPMAVKVVIQEPEQGTTTTTPTTIISVPKPPQDKGKGIMIEELKKKKKDLLEKKVHQIEEANIAWDDVQAKIEADYPLAQRLQSRARRID
ncbi:hypothetical protein Tco_1393082 [Tanacetum coccineum]